MLHAIFATAGEDGLVSRNPCVLTVASVERPAERPVATIEQVFELADAIEPNLRARCCWQRSAAFVSATCARCGVDTSTCCTER